jgi:acetyl esterase/lipase
MNMNKNPNLHQRNPRLIMTSTIILSLILTGNALSFSQSEDSVITLYAKCWTDLNYTGDNERFHQLDIYLPNSNKSPFPAIVVIYGSAWFGNDGKSTAFRVLGESLLESGFAVVAINHRSSRDAIFPAQIIDVKAAIRFIRANASTYQIDPEFIGVTGFSSGGHLSALAGTSGSVKEYTVNSSTADLEGNIGSFTSFSSAVNAVVDWFGPTSFQMMDECDTTMNHNAPDSPESSLIGGSIQDNLDKVALADPVTYVDEKDPPFLILHGDADNLVPYCQSQILSEALQKKNVPCQLVIVSNAGHGPGLFEDAYFEMMTAFFTSEYSKLK